MLPTKDDEARKLAQVHYQVEEGITQIHRITGAADIESLPTEPIKLLEVNRNTIPTGVMPLRFGAAPARGIPYPSVIVEVTPEEYLKIQTAELKLPDGWTLGDLIPKPTGNGA